MKPYLYAKTQSRVASIIRKNISIEYTSSSESEQARGLTTDTWVVIPSREQALIAAEKILTLLGITKDENGKGI
jgi:hypothetical protein